MAVQLTSKYVIDDARCLGSGGMGEVFAGRIIGLEGVSHPVAIKRIRPDHIADERYRAMFVTEARLAARLSHTNLVKVFDLGQDEAGRLFLVMELVEGVDLARLLCTGALPIPVALFVMAEVLRGLGHAHTFPTSEDAVRGLIHRDVSPVNVMIGWDGAVKVSDFGLAKARHATEASASFSTQGKAAYLSPEQARGGPIDGRSDLYSAGVMLWEMLCGERLFGSDNMAATLTRALFAPIPPPRWRQDDVPDDVTHVTMRLLDRDRAARYPNAASALLALSECSAYPKTGRELLASLLRERMPERARQHRTEHAQPSTPPSILARPEAPPTPRLSQPDRAEATATAPRIEPLLAHGDPYPPIPRRKRSRLVLLIAIATAAPVLTLVIASHVTGESARLSPSTGIPARPESPAHQQPHVPRANISPSAPASTLAAALTAAAPSSAARGGAPRQPAAAPSATATATATVHGVNDSGILMLDLGPPPPPRRAAAATLR